MEEKLLKKKEITKEKMEAAIAGWMDFQKKNGLKFANFTSYEEVKSKESRKTARYRLFKDNIEFVYKIPVKYALRYMIEGHI